MEVVTGSAIEMKIDQLIQLNTSIDKGINALIAIILCIFIVWFFFRDLDK